MRAQVGYLMAWAFETGLMWAVYNDVEKSFLEFLDSKNNVVIWQNEDTAFDNLYLHKFTEK